ncbi:hypothetical protein [Salipiger abyssi]|uniref:hypothetical protein n=1 Tax=Salipiger abyssi TaxID=1250539 RepID=UPI001A8C6B80|nr:hypothetical protein [Salipiger abyssi]MBN9889685.1 hypothetical protein [Salipiger abyssi]
MYVHDAITHSRLSDLFDMAEDMILGRGCYSPDVVEQVLFDRYMYFVSAYLSGCTQYLLTEERCAGESFICELCEKAGATKFLRYSYKMAEQLMAQPRFYFPNFEQMATAKYLDMLNNIDDVDRLRFSGLVLFAVAHIPGARSDMRRILRRRGIDGGERYIPTLVADETMTQRIRAVQGLPPVGKGRKRIRKHA